MLCCVVLRSAVPYYAVLRSAVLCCIEICCAVLRCVVSQDPGPLIPLHCILQHSLDAVMITCLIHPIYCSDLD